MQSFSLLTPSVQSVPRRSGHTLVNSEHSKLTSFRPTSSTDAPETDDVVTQSEETSQLCSDYPQKVAQYSLSVDTFRLKWQHLLCSSIVRTLLAELPERPSGPLH